MHPRACSANLGSGHPFPGSNQLCKTPDREVIAVPPFPIIAGPGVGKILDPGPACRLTPVHNAGFVERGKYRQCPAMHQSGANLSVTVDEFPQREPKGSADCWNSCYNYHAACFLAGLRATADRGYRTLFPLIEPRNRCGRAPMLVTVSSKSWLVCMVGQSTPA